MKEIRNPLRGVVAKIKGNIEIGKTKFMEQRYAHEIKELFSQVGIQLFLNASIQKCIELHSDWKVVPIKEAGSFFAIAIPIILTFLNNRSGIMGDRSKEGMSQLESASRNLISSFHTMKIPKDESEKIVYQKIKVVLYEIINDVLQAVKYYLQTPQEQLHLTGEVVAESSKFSAFDSKSVKRLDDIKIFAEKHGIDISELSILLEQLKETESKGQAAYLHYNSGLVGQLSEILHSLENILVMIKSLPDNAASGNAKSQINRFHDVANSAMHLKGRAEIQGQTALINRMVKVYGYILPVITMQLGFIGSALANTIYSFVTTVMLSLAKTGMKGFDLPEGHPDRIDPETYLKKVKEQLDLYMKKAKAIEEDLIAKENGGSKEATL